MSNEIGATTSRSGEFAAETAARVQLFAALADLKLQQYQLMVMFDALAEALDRRGLLPRAELTELRRRLDRRVARRALTRRPRSGAATLRAPS